MTRTRPSAAPLVLAWALAFGAPLAHAQPAASPTAAQAVDIAAQPLGAALNELARQTGLELAVQPQAVAGRTAPAVSGRLTARQALDQLLAGSGLQGSIQGTAMVVTPVAAVSGGGEATLSAITVTASADASAQGLAAAYAGGQVARGARVGILGTQDTMDTPFSVTSYTHELIQNQQARSVADVLQNDPSVRIARGFGNFQESYFIRGFVVGSDDIAYNGLYGIMPRQYTSAELFERVELLRGASAFLNGAAPGGGVGGTLNLVPKRAPNEPLSQVSLGWASGSQHYAAADIARRFGPDQATGVRLNVAHRKGGTGLSGEDVDLDVASIGLDWRDSRTRLSADVGFQNYKLQGARPNVNLGTTTVVPQAPDNGVNYAQPWTHAYERDLYATARGERDLSDTTTAWAAVGALQGREDNRLANVTLTDGATGDASAYRFDNRRQETTLTGETGVRHRFNTGAIQHTLTAALSYYQSKEKNAYAMDFFNTRATNIYRPSDWALPAISGSAFTGGDLSNPGPLTTTRLTSLALGDTVSLLDDRLLVTAGLRYQKISSTTYDYVSDRNGDAYDTSRTSPVLGLVYKLRPQVSLYANYIEGLAKGENIVGDYTNAGQALPPYVSKQKEVGLKYDGGRIGAGVTLFSTDQPGKLVENKTVTANGKNRHQGIELNAYGEPVRGWRVLGGVTLLDAQQKRTGDAETEGKRVIGVPRQQANVGVEWDVPPLRGLTLDTRIVRTGSSYADSANTLRVPGWTRLDLGARYVTEFQGKLLTLRGRINNATNRNYWASSGGYPGNGYLVLGAPRTFALTATVDF
ncbi:MAG: Ferrichrome receptor FcuA [Paracidovorax wautersii]|uniref:Ferrichrome receptor FcuA n=1 Tax=Paracidovorax wautersii TaxID=1177982 RepID=A0A7V8FP77_9BURK|nr:MAG: Ferrichrome receptor FcuA [Paracidovorax wautersii]